MRKKNFSVTYNLVINGMKFNFGIERLDHNSFTLNAKALYLNFVALRNINATGNNDYLHMRQLILEKNTADSA